MSHELLKPYTEEERINFIVQYNHNMGLLIEETETALYALEANEIMQDGIPIIDPEYDNKLEQQERERIGKLKCTKRIFALMLQEVGIDYLTMLKPLIESNSQAQLEWELCVELERSNPLLDVMAIQMGITSEHLDLIFRYANGELTDEQFLEMVAKIVTPEEGVPTETPEDVEPEVTEPEVVEPTDVPEENVEEVGPTPEDVVVDFDTTEGTEPEVVEPTEEPTTEPEV